MVLSMLKFWEGLFFPMDLDLLIPLFYPTCQYVNPFRNSLVLVREKLCKLTLEQSKESFEVSLGTSEIKFRTSNYAIKVQPHFQIIGNRSVRNVIFLDGGSPVYFLVETL
ncbi:hypothetical protein J6590_027423 [Homalodisca vitripennis]|nr:hypothetical protein J6590_027423 [Homalodisca vitripennis]